VKRHTTRKRNRKIRLIAWRKHLLRDRHIKIRVDADDALRAIMRLQDAIKVFGAISTPTRTTYMIGVRP